MNNERDGETKEERKKKVGGMGYLWRGMQQHGHGMWETPLEGGGQREPDLAHCVWSCFLARVDMKNNSWLAKLLLSFPHSPDYFKLFLNRLVIFIYFTYW